MTGQAPPKAGRHGPSCRCGEREVCAAYLMAEARVLLDAVEREVSGVMGDSAQARRLASWMLLTGALHAITLSADALDRDAREPWECERARRIRGAGQVIHDGLLSVHNAIMRDAEAVTPAVLTRSELPESLPHPGPRD